MALGVSVASGAPRDAAGARRRRGAVRDVTRHAAPPRAAHAAAAGRRAAPTAGATRTRHFLQWMRLTGHSF